MLCDSIFILYILTLLFYFKNSYNHRIKHFEYSMKIEYALFTSVFLLGNRNVNIILTSEKNETCFRTNYAYCLLNKCNILSVPERILTNV